MTYRQALPLFLLLLVTPPVRAQQALADSIVHYQLPNGGWMKNQDWVAGCDQAAYRRALDRGIGATIDNGATWREMRQLALVLQNGAGRLTAERRSTYSNAFLRGLRFLLAMQYANGGFPQFYPYEGAEPYARHITLNDDAMVSVLQLLRDVALRRPPIDAVEVGDSLRAACRDAVERGVDCLLACQIRHPQTGQPTVWCQQHDEQTLQPAAARRYELPSYGGCGESVQVLLFLMELEKPSLQVCQAVEAGVQWLWNHRITDMKLERFTNADGQPDQRLVPLHAGEQEQVLLARFYDLTTEQPFYCDRDGIPHPHLSDIGYERRNGYAWVRPFPMKLVQTYLTWCERNGCQPRFTP